ncbi:MAG: M48 family metallopeptidase [Synergistaceae bacterium]|jgi:predicted metal-dependent hydrolase|nr:M48 family metallopeptidase [Synergistaceae bacterium]
MERRYADGEIFPYRGAKLELSPPDGEDDASALAASSVSISGARLVVRPRSADERRRHLIYWYTSESEKIARALVPKWSKALGARPRLVAVKHAKTRWGSCSSSGRLFFNSRLAMLSDDVAEYIVVHELCHLKQMNHSAAFWDEVRSALPQALARRRKLREQEREAVL